MKEVSALVLAGQKIADIPVDPRHCDAGFGGEVFYGEVHGDVILLRLGVCYIRRRCARFGHDWCLTDVEMPTVCNTHPIPCYCACQLCNIAWNVCNPRQKRNNSDSAERDAS